MMGVWVSRRRDDDGAVRVLTAACRSSYEAASLGARRHGFMSKLYGHVEHRYAVLVKASTAQARQGH
jgi:hypothetical protein